MLTKLEAVNELLDAISESPVSTLDSGLPDASDAERHLDRVSKQVQALGWHMNTDYDYLLAKDTDDRIPLATNILRVDTTGRDAWRDVTIRFLDEVRYLYDLKNQTYEFNSAVKANVVRYYEFEQLPPEMQMYIAVRASKLFQQHSLGSVVRDQFMGISEMEARYAFTDAEVSAEDLNILRATPHMRFTTFRRSYFGRMY